MNRFTQIFIDTETGRWLTQPENQSFGMSSVSATQFFENDTWVITHNKSSNKFVVQIKDTNEIELLPDEVEITDLNTITITFTEPVKGQVNILFF